MHNNYYYPGGMSSAAGFIIGTAWNMSSHYIDPVVGTEPVQAESYQPYFHFFLMAQGDNSAIGIDLATDQRNRMLPSHDAFPNTNNDAAMQISAATPEVLSFGFDGEDHSSILDHSLDDLKSLDSKFNSDSETQIQDADDDEFSEERLHSSVAELVTKCVDGLETRKAMAREIDELVGEKNERAWRIEHLVNDNSLVEPITAKRNEAHALFDKMPKKSCVSYTSMLIELVREILIDPIRVTVGEVGMANEDITQVVQVIHLDAEKLPWLLEQLPSLIDQGDVLVFASKKATVDELEPQLAQRGFRVAALHGDKDQASCTKTLQKFKAGTYHVLIAIDVAARGLDIKSIKSIVNFDIAKDMDMHVHSIGRTDRASELVNSLITIGQNMPIELMDLVMRDGRFRSKHDARKAGGKRAKGRRGCVRGVDFGLGIGYNSAIVNSLKT